MALPGMRVATAIATRQSEACDQGERMREFGNATRAFCLRGDIAGQFEGRCKVTGSDGNDRRR